MAASVAALFRMAGAGWVLAREGAFTLVDPEELPSGPRMAARIARALARRGVTEEARSERLTAALNRLGPSYIKLGQFLATRPDLVGREGADALGRLRDEIDPTIAAISTCLILVSVISLLLVQWLGKARTPG